MVGEADLVEEEEEAVIAIDTIIFREAVVPINFTEAAMTFETTTPFIVTPHSVATADLRHPWHTENHPLEVKAPAVVGSEMGRFAMVAVVLLIMAEMAVAPLFDVVTDLVP